MKNLIFIFSILILVSCGQSTQEAKVDTDSAMSDTTSMITIEADTIVTAHEVNPAFYVAPGMEGTDFGNFFNTLYKQGKFEDMLAFTSSQSINQFGKDVILEFYKNELKFGYEIGKPHSQSVAGNITTLNYDANIIATKRVIRISVVVENDSCKVVLPNDLHDFPG